MHDGDCFRKALCVALSWQGKNPAFAATLRSGGFEAAVLRRQFVEAVNVRCCYFRHAYRVPDGSGDKVDAAVYLADKAEAWLQGGGQADLIAGTWWWLTRDGHLDGLATNVRLVLHGVFVLAMEHGPAVPCATRYMALLLECQFGVKLSHTTVAACYRQLSEARFGGTGVEVQRGRSGQSARSSTVVDLRPLLMSGTPDAPEDVRAELTMFPGVAEALEAYRTDARASRKTVAAEQEKKRVRAEEAHRRFLDEQAAADEQLFYEWTLVEMRDLGAELLDEPEGFTRLVPPYPSAG